MTTPIALPRACRTPQPDRHALALEELRTGKVERALILGAACLLAVFLAWAQVTRLPEIAVTQGEVATSVAAAPVQHLEGGIVEAVLVSEGEVVKEGQPLLRLNDTAVRADLGQLRVRAASLRLQADRLAALVEGGAMPEEGIAALLGPQRAALAARLLAQASRAATVAEQVAQRRSEIDTLNGQVAALDRQIPIYREELETRQSLARQGLSTRVAVMEAQRLLLGAEADRERFRNQIVTATRAVAEAEARSAELRSSAIDEARQEAARVAQELAEAEEAINRLQDRADRTLVRAPSAGIVRGLAVQRPGSVIQPGQLIAEVLPLDSTLVVDARIGPRDIGFVAVGQDVTVKVQSFDYARFGTVPGRVERISAGSFLDEQHQPYYRARIGLSRDYVGNDPKARLAAGMIVQADITTGHKTVMQYLLKPLFAATAMAFRER